MITFENSPFNIAINRAFEEKDVNKLVSLQSHFLSNIEYLHSRRIETTRIFPLTSKEYLDELESLVKDIKIKIRILIEKNY